MADTVSKHIDMTTGSLWRNIPLFAFPVAATSILEQLSNLIATVIIGNFSGDQGTLAMAAVGSNVPLTSLMLNLFIGMSLGSNVVIANAIGRNDQNMVKRAVHTSILMALVGFVVIALGEIFAEPMLAALNVPAETMPLASLYLRVFLLSMPSILLYNFEAAIFRSVGITRMPLQALAVSTVLNIGLDLIFVPVLHWGVAGVAIATAIAYTVSAATLFIRLLKTDSVVRVTPRDLAIDPVALKRIVKIGLPAGIQSAVFAVANIIIQSAINSPGTVVMAASSAAFNIEIITYDILNAFSQACTTFVGQNYGAGRLDRVKRSVWVTLAIGVIYTLCTGAALLAGQDAILHLFTADEAVVTYGKLAMRWFCPFYFLLSILHGLAGAVRGTGASIPPMVVLLVSLCLFRVVWIQFLLPFFSGIEGVFILYPVSWGLGALLMILYAWKGKWMEYHT